MNGATVWIWYASGALLGAAAVALAVWALLWDHPRGRVRCPKCWYSMEGITPIADERAGQFWRCPECGRRTRGEGRLRRTRRRWGWAVVACAMLYGAAQIALAPTAGRDGWWRFVPTCALALSADYNNWSSPATDRLSLRLVQGFAFPWDRTLARRMERQHLPRDWSTAVLARREWPVGVPLRVQITRQGQGWMWSISEVRVMEMTPAGVGAPRAAVEMLPLNVAGHPWVAAPPDFIDLPPPAHGANTYELDLVLKSDGREIARRRVDLHVQGVPDTAGILKAVDPTPRERIDRMLQFGISGGPERPSLYVSVDGDLWQRTDFTRAFLVRLWAEQTLIGESNIDAELTEAVFALDPADETIAALLRDGGRYLDISGMQLEFVPDELAALRALRRSAYSSERALVPLRSIPLLGVGPNPVRLRGTTVPLTPKPSDTWFEENAPSQGS